ncbi:MAG TPA: NAD(P)-dependent oxidoreductase [Actinomycetota bacterium]
MRILLAGATGVIGRQAVPVLTGAGHQVIGLANRPARLPGADLVVADALDPAAVAGAVRSAAPDVIVHMLTAIPDPIDPRHLARDMALTNRLRSEGTANLVAAAGGAARIIAQGIAYAYEPTGSPVKDEDAPQGGFTRQLRAGKVPIVGDGGSMFSFLHAHDAATALLAAVDHPAASGALNIVDDQPTLARDWLPEMAAWRGAPAPGHIPARLARLFAGGWGVAFMTSLAGASNLRARQQLDWTPTYGSWRDGLAAERSVATR